MDTTYNTLSLEYNILNQAPQKMSAGFSQFITCLMDIIIILLGLRHIQPSTYTNTTTP